MSGLSSVARTLNKGDLSYAMIAATLLKLPNLDWDGGVRIAQTDEKLSKYDPNEPRDARRRWTNNGVNEVNLSDRNQSFPNKLVSISINAEDTPRTLDQCVAECTDLTLGATKLPPGVLGIANGSFVDV